jgi:hypothetical protein
MEAEGSCKGGEGGKGLHGGCWGALQEGVNCEGQRLCQVHCFYLLEWPLHGESEKQWSKGVALLHPALQGRQNPGELVHEEVAVLTIGPHHHGKHGCELLLHGGQHLVPAQGVEGVLHGNAGGSCAPRNLAAPANAKSDLKWGQGLAGLRTGSQGVEGGKPVPDFAVCDGSDDGGWLANGRR